MWKLFLIVFTLVCIEKVVPVHSFTCYISEPTTKSKNGYLNRTHTIRNCKDQAKTLLTIPISVPENGPISCFKLTGTDPNGKKADIKGCIETGKCIETVANVMKNGTKIGQDLRLFAGSECFECEGDNCNSATNLNVHLLLVTLVFFIYFMG